MQTIAIAFTLKGQNFSDIRKCLELLSAQVGREAILVHGFMSRQAVIDKGFSTEVVDALAELFPYQLNCFVDGHPKRQEMANILKAQRGTVYTIGEVKEGVLEEVDLYKSAGVNVCALPINWNGNMIGRELTFGEKAVGISFNPGGSPQVNAVKRRCADAIDELDLQRSVAKSENNGEKIAQFTLAIRDIQSGQMWGVKAATWQY
jgi:hypothetical protein